MESLTTLKEECDVSLDKSEIYIKLPNGERIGLLSEMHTANCDFGDFDEPIENLLRSYNETTDLALKDTIEQKIDAQCSAFADFLGIQYREIQSLISFDDLSTGIKQTLVTPKI